MSFRDHNPAAWLFHQNTIRWPFNTLEPDVEAADHAPFKEYPAAPWTALPAPRPLDRLLDAAIRERLSCRSFSPEPLALDGLATMLARSYGVQGVVHFGAREHLERPVPSGGGLYPLEIYPVARRVSGLEAGIYHYAPLAHGLEQLQAVELSAPFVTQVFMNQPYVADAAAIVVLTAVVDRTLHRYGDRGYRYILLEAGHVAQNVVLTAGALGLGALPLGGFFDAWLAEMLGIDLAVEVILYAVAVGPSRAEATERVDRRNLEFMLGG